MSFDPTALFKLGFFLALFCFTLHAIVISYHLISFGANRSSATLAIGIYIGGGAVLLSVLVGTLTFL